MTRITHSLFATHIRVSENEQALVLKNGRFYDILTPGKHSLAGIKRVYDVQGFSLTQPVFISDYADALITSRADLEKAHLTVIETAPDEVAVISRAGRVYAVQRPENRSIFWTASSSLRAS